MQLLGLTLAVLLPLAGQDEPRRADDVARRVDEIIAHWMREPEREDDELAARLVQLGPVSEPHLCGLLAGDLGSPAIEPVARALGRVGRTADAVRSLAGLVRSPNASHRASGAASLGQLRDVRGMPDLVIAIDDGDVEVRGAACQAILTIATRNPRFDVSARLRERFAKLKHLDPFAQALGRLGTPLAREMLRELLTRWSDDRAMLAGLSGLWWGGQEEDAASVRELMQASYSIPVRKSACLVLGRLRDRSATRILIDSLAEEDRGLVANAHWALRQITGLRLRADPALWETWWDRGGRSGPGGPADLARPR